MTVDLALVPPPAFDDASPDDILAMIKSSSGTRGAAGEERCKLMRDVETLPPNIRAAVEMAIADKDVSNNRIVMFINGNSPIRVSRNSMQQHRNHATGCTICGVTV